MLEGLRIAQYRFALEARTPIHLPAYKGGVLRGALGTILKRVSCSLRDGRCPECVLRPSCPYGVIFESGPGPDAERLRNFDQVARPFVLRPPADQRTVVDPGEDLEFTLILVGRAIEYLPYFIVVFRELGEAGIGLWKDGKRGRAFLRRVTGVNPLTNREERVFEGACGRVYNVDLVVRGEELERWSRGLPRRALGIEFLTMTRLQHESQLAHTPEFHVLTRALLRRLSTLAFLPRRDGRSRLQGDYRPGRGGGDGGADHQVGELAAVLGQAEGGHGPERAGGEGALSGGSGGVPATFSVWLVGARGQERHLRAGAVQVFRLSAVGLSRSGQAKST